MLYRTTSGCRLHIGGPRNSAGDPYPARWADFAGMTWREIGGLEVIGNLGVEWSDSEEGVIGFQAPLVEKGDRRPSRMEIVCAMNPRDPGQVALEAAAADGARGRDYGFRLNFEGDGETHPWAVRMWFGLVVRSTARFDGVIRRVSEIVVRSAVVEMEED